MALGDEVGLKAAQQADATAKTLIDRIAALEAQSARDVNAIADKVIAAVLPEVQKTRGSIETCLDNITLTVNASVTECLAMARRLDGANMTFKLGPEVVPGTENQ